MTQSTTKVVCPYCNRIADRVTGSTIYPHRRDLHRLRFYRCEPCDAYVGTHKGTWQPLGRMANKELRAAKIEAHLEFDFIWKTGIMTRTGAYLWLATKLQIEPAVCHIGMFDIEMCKKVIRVCQDRAADHYAEKGSEA